MTRPKASSDWAACAAAREEPQWLLSHIGSQGFPVRWCSWLRRKRNKSARKLDAQLAHLSKHFAGWQALAITSEHIDRYTNDRITQNTQPVGGPSECEWPAAAGQEGLRCRLPHAGW